MFSAGLAGFFVGLFGAVGGVGGGLAGCGGFGEGLLTRGLSGLNALGSFGVRGADLLGGLRAHRSELLVRLGPEALEFGGVLGSGLVQLGVGGAMDTSSPRTYTISTRPGHTERSHNSHRLRPRPSHHT